MSELARFYGIVVSVYFRDVGKHNLPHIHVSDAEFEASVLIKDGRVLDGKIPRSSLKLVRDWLKRYRPEVEAAWYSAVNGERVGKIKPARKGKVR